MPLPADHEASQPRHINAQVQFLAEGEVRAVVVHGIPLFHFTCGDKAGEALAMVMLIEEKLATPTEVAAAFECARLTVYRRLDRYESGGLERLTRQKSGPKGGRIPLSANVT